MKSSNQKIYNFLDIRPTFLKPNIFLPFLLPPVKSWMVCNNDNPFGWLIKRTNPKCNSQKRIPVLVCVPCSANFHVCASCYQWTRSRWCKWSWTPYSLVHSSPVKSEKSSSCSIPVWSNYNIRNRLTWHSTTVAFSTMKKGKGGSE